MKTFIFACISIGLVFNFKAYSQVLLVPDKTSDFSEYQKACQKVGYKCMMDFHIETIKNSESKVWNDFLNQLDYSSHEFKKNFIQKVLKLLKSEQLGQDQIEMLFKIISQTKDFLENHEKKQLHYIEEQLNDILAYARAHELKEPTQHFIMIFKTPLSLTSLKKIKINLLKINMIHIEFNKSLNSNNELITGSCENSKIDESLENYKWQAFKSQSCGFTEDFLKFQNSSASFIKENKHTLITTGIIVIGAALFFNKYEVKFNF